MRKIRTLGLVVLAALAGYATAQAATRFAAIRVDGTSDLRGAMLAKLTTLASSSSAAGLNLPHGSAPSSPVNGDVWTTSTGLFSFINGATTGPYSTATVNSGNFVATFTTACTVNPTVTFNYSVVGTIVQLRVASVTGFPCTSNSTSFTTASGSAPSVIRPISATAFPAGFFICQDSGANINCGIKVATNGTITLCVGGASGLATCADTNWTASGNKQLSTAATNPNITGYNLN